VSPLAIGEVPTGELGGAGALGSGGGVHPALVTGAVGIGSGAQLNVAIVLNPKPPLVTLLSSHTMFARSGAQAELSPMSNAHPSACMGGTLPVLCWNRLPHPDPAATVAVT
jgi:hypothetical protein